LLSVLFFFLGWTSRHFQVSLCTSKEQKFAFPTSWSPYISTQLLKAEQHRCWRCGGVRRAPVSHSGCFAGAVPGSTAAVPGAPAGRSCLSQPTTFSWPPARRSSLPRSSSWSLAYIFSI